LWLASHIQGQTVPVTTRTENELLIERNDSAHSSFVLLRRVFVLECSHMTYMLTCSVRKCLVLNQNLNTLNRYYRTMVGNEREVASHRLLQR